MRGSVAKLPRMFAVRGWISRLAVVGVFAPALVGAALPAHAVQARQSTVVSAVPAGFTPLVHNGTVFAMAEVGGQIVIGGTFTTASPASHPGTVYSRPDVLAFNATSGAIDGGFRPKVNGKVDSVIPGPKPDEVYIGGTFSTVNGVTTRVALLNIHSGAIVPGWHMPQLNGVVDKLLLSHGRLYVAGTFDKVGHNVRRGLASLDPSSGKLTSYLRLPFTGHHNYGTKCNPHKDICAKGTPRVRSLDVDPAGSRMVVVGNFIHAAGLPRDQVAMIDLGKSGAVVSKRWSTLAYSAKCDVKSFDSYIRDVQFAPGGNYFVIVATGGAGVNSDHTDSSCDSAARYNTADHGADVRPKWVAYTGSDSLWTTAITGTAVYVGGHQRWLNNKLGMDEAGPGAIPRPGLAALSPVSGLPLSWNPGRDPRGAGTFALLATSGGLWTGSDTDYIGNQKYLRPKVAFFPLAGGQTLPAERTPALPGRVFEAGALSGPASDRNRLAFREFNGNAVGHQKRVGTGMAWGSVRGAFTVDGNVVYGKSDGNLYQRRFDGSSLGSEVKLDPFHDPIWDNVQTGSGQTYRGALSPFSQEIPQVTSMFFIHGKLYYTLRGTAAMRWRWFEPESGAVDATEHRVSDHVNWSDVAGAFYSRKVVYFASRSTAKLMAVNWRKHKAKGHPRVVNHTKDWASRGLFMLSQKTNPTPTPVAKFFTRCNPAGKCKLTATRWNDPDGGIVKYQWAWGDGRYSRATTATSARHQYLTDGHHKITLIVTTTDGAIAYASYTIKVSRPVKKIGFVGTSSTADRAAKVKVKVPRATKAGNALLLFDSVASSSVVPRPLKGWVVVGKTAHRGLTTIVYRRVATRHDAGSSVRLKYPHRVSSSVILAAYRRTSVLPVELKASTVSGATKVHPSPSLQSLSRGAWALVYAAQTSRVSTSWRTPHGMHRRRSVGVRHHPVVGAVLADTGKAAPGAFSVGPTTSRKVSKSAAQWTIALAPAFA